MKNSNVPELNFDEEIPRTGSNSIKWEFKIQGTTMVPSDQSDLKYGKERMLPLWVADMDFRCPQPVIDALQARVAHGIFGYSAPVDSYYEALIAWTARRYGRSIKKEWVVLSPGVIPAVYLMIQTYTNPGDKIIIQPPVYYPFAKGIKNNDRVVVSNSLVLENGRYQMDFDDLAEKAADPAAKMLILCSPHNPVGRVWSREELTRLGEICLANDVLVVSDEIHGDLIYDDVTFTSYGVLSEELSQSSIVCTAPSKTFNLAGLKNSSIIIPDKKLRLQFVRALERVGLGGSNAFGFVAAEAAYRHGEPWLAAVMAYVQENYRFMEAYLAEHLPQLTLIQPEGTYLVWLDCRALEMDAAARKELLMNQARLWLDEGEMFGPEGEGFERFNIACPRSILAEALDRLRTAVTRQALKTGM
jgi:cystathionine beta-lyase